MDESRHVIEALRSGIPSRTVGKYFSEARPQMLRLVSDMMNDVLDGGDSRSMIYTGRYGEGKTHLLNTVFSMAHENNMVVSILPISKEAPLDKIQEIYPQIVANTYLPGREQPGFLDLLNRMSLNSQESAELQLFAARELECDKLYYILRTYLNTRNEELKYSLRMDFEGNFYDMKQVKKAYKELFKETVHMNRNFSKNKHGMDYICFLSALFKAMHYQGWVILFDECEMIGRFPRKQRMNCYRNLAKFLKPTPALKSTMTLFAFSSSYTEEVIDKKHDLDTFQAVFPDEVSAGHGAINAIINAHSLPALTYQEIEQVVGRILEFHGKAYHWEPDVTVEELMKVTENSGMLLRTKLRASIEYLDQVFQYGKPGRTTVGSLNSGSYEEMKMADDVPSLEDLKDDE